MQEKRALFKPVHKPAKTVCAYDVKQKQALVFDSVRAAARRLNADRETLTSYLSNPDKGLYLCQWRLNYKS